MANRRRGEASFKVDGVSYTIVLDHNAFAEVEDVLDVNIGELLALLATKQQVRHMRALLFAGLREKHPDITLRDAGNLFSAGKEEAEAIGRAIAQALEQSLPELKDAAANAAQGAGGAAPLAGTGKRSSAPGRKPASSRKPSGKKPRGHS